MAANSSPSSTTTIHDVFLSFRGTDTRNNFTSHLLAALDRQGFSTFHDDTKLRRGENISSELLKAIERSRLSIVVFSKNYAGSRWCLDELVKIMECRRELNQIVLPIFYDVAPLDVRAHYRGCYSEAFCKHDQRRMEGTLAMSRVEGWKAALTEAANLSGWDLQHTANGNEARFIDIVVEDISSRFDRLFLNVAAQPVGINSRVRELEATLMLESDDVRIVAIWGIGGLGKTTIAKALFNCIHDRFEGSSFLADVSETSKSSHGKVTLQKQLLSNILMTQTYKLDNHHQGIEEIKRKLCNRKVLLVIDDVGDAEQLKMLAINRDLFCSGSRIIITTKNISSVDFLAVDMVYSPSELNKEESVKLLSLSAFNTTNPKDGYEDLLKEVAAYAGGLPLALEVLGSSAFGKGTDEWKSMLEDLETSPRDDINRKLKISFDSLDKKNKELFLDIAFFFIGRDKDFTVKVLEDSRLRSPEIRVRELVRRCLVRVNGDNELWMHDLLRDMGREVVLEESLKDPGKRSRLWYQEDVLDVLRDCTGTNAIEGLYLELAAKNDEYVNTVAFANMSNLRLLHLNYLCGLRGTYIISSTKLKWICWHGFPLSYVQAELYMGNLVALDLQYSKLKEVWKQPKRLDKLRFLYLGHSYHLTKTPDFSGLKSLEQLLLHDCTNLVEVHSSIGCLDKLLILNMSNCKNLSELPSSLFTLKALQHLDLSGCPKLDERLRSKGPVSIFWQMLTKRQDCIAISMASVQGLSCLMNLDLKDCNLLNVPCEIDTLVSLEVLCLDGNNFCSLPSDLSKLSRLRNVFLNWCVQLKSLPKFHDHVELLHADNCLLLDSESVELQIGKGNQTRFLNCPVVDWKNAGYYLQRNILHSKKKEHQYDLLFSGGEIPNGFQFKCSGSRFSFVVPPIINKKIIGVTVCVVSSSPNADINYKLTNRSQLDQFIDVDLLYSTGYPGEFTWLSHVPLPQSNSGFHFSLSGGDEVDLEFYDYNDDPLKRCGACLMYEGDEEIEAKNVSISPLFSYYFRDSTSKNLYSLLIGRIM